MNTKNLMVSFVAIAMALFLVATVSALEITPEALISVDGTYVVDTYENTTDVIESNINVIAGETITVKVYFTAEIDDTDVTITAEIEGDKIDTEVESEVFDVEEDSKYREVLNIKVPYELKDEISGTVTLNIKIEGKNHETEILPITLNVQKPSYNVAFKSINVDKNVETGETFSVDVVLKNTGYNDLEDLFVTARISELNLEQRFWFGDLLHVETDDDDYDDDDTDTLYRRFSFSIPHGIESGAYTLEVEVSNDDTVLSKTVIVEITNKFPSTVIKSGNDLILVNPTDSMVGYKIVAGDSASVSESIVFVQAGSSETVTVTPNAEGEYNFDVVVFSMSGEVVRAVTFSGSEEEVSQLASPIVMLTIVLGIIFLVLLVVLIVLVTKKPEKAEEFGESYY